MTFLLAPLPDDILDWRGSAAELAEQVNQLLPQLGVQEEVGTVNERLVRYYVTKKVLTPPDREGREALFGYRQVVELLVTRYLMKDGWPLEKIAAMVQSSDLDSLVAPSNTGAGPSRAPTRAEQTIAQFRKGGRPARPASPPMAYMMAPPDIHKAAQLTRRKSALSSSLKFLGNPQGRPQRQRSVRIDLTPWCQVHIDENQLNQLTDEAAEALGTALTHTLQEERIKSGDKS